MRRILVGLFVLHSTTHLIEMTYTFIATQIVCLFFFMPYDLKWNHTFAAMQQLSGLFHSVKSLWNCGHTKMCARASAFDRVPNAQIHEAKYGSIYN